MVGFSGSANSNMLSEFSAEQGSCHGNQIWAIISQNCTDFSPVQDIAEFYAWIIAFWGRRIQIYYLNFQGSKGSFHDNQIWAKIIPNCTDFSSVQDVETIFACMVGFFGVGAYKYAIRMFKGAKGVAMATKLRQKPKLHYNYTINDLKNSKNQCKKLLSLKHSVRATYVVPLKQQKSVCLTPWCAKDQMCPYKTSCCVDHLYYT